MIVDPFLTMVRQFGMCAPSTVVLRAGGHRRTLYVEACFRLNHLVEGADVDVEEDRTGSRTEPCGTPNSKMT